MGDLSNLFHCIPVKTNDPNHQYQFTTHVTADGDTLKLSDPNIPLNNMNITIDHLDYICRRNFWDQVNCSPSKYNARNGWVCLNGETTSLPDPDEYFAQTIPLQPLTPNKYWIQFWIWVAIIYVILVAMVLISKYNRKPLVH